MKIPLRILKKLKKFKPYHKTTIRTALVIGVFLIVVALLLVATKYSNNDSSPTDNVPFPIGVDPQNKQIIENPLVDSYVETYLSINIDQSRKQRIFDRLMSQLSTSDFYQNLASPNTRILVIYPGERKEEIAKNFGDILKWNKTQRDEFISLVSEAEPIFPEGKFYPGRYIVEAKSSPEVISQKLTERFNEKILSKYDANLQSRVPLEEALIIASLLEREAYDFVDMRFISGIIWNRLFIDMPLQLDASLQYVRGSNIYEPKWWPKVNPADKFLTSPFNTYKNKGLPPSAISNPSAEAVVAALNPRQTDCLFYFHGQGGEFYCSVTYAEHVKSLREIYGQGK